MNVDDKAQALVNYIESLGKDFKFVEVEVGETYGHMGAAITDAMLQAGINYKYVVRPRVRHVRDRYPEARTTSGFLRVLTEVDPNNLLRWKGVEKPRRVLGVARFFSEEGIETEADLQEWLQEPDNLTRLRQLRGVGKKTADYFKMLAGIQTCAVDTHLFAFLRAANIEVRGYDEAHQIIDKAADLTGVNRRSFDHSIWKYMST